MCVCLCARSACTPPLLAGLCGVGVCAWAGVSAAPRHSWLGCSGVCVFVCPLRLYPATPGRGVWCGCVCLGLGFGYTPPLLAGVLGCLCVCVRAPPVPRHSWLGCVVWVCVLGLGFWLRPATPGWGVRVCVCLCAQSACTPPLLVGVCGVGVCAWARVSAAPRHFWLGCWGVCVFVCALRLYPATPGWGLWCVGWLLPGTCSCAVVPCVLCALPGFAAPAGRFCLAVVRVPWLWPAACLSGVPCGPALVRRASSGSVALRAPVGFTDAVVPFPITGACAPGFTGRLRGARGGRPRTGVFVPAAGPRRGSGSGLAPVVPVWGPAMGLSLAGPSGVGLGLRALRWLACVDLVTDASGFPYRPSFDRGLGWCTRAVSCGRRHRPFRVGGRQARVPRVCACACSAWPAWAGRPPRRVLVRLTFSVAALSFFFVRPPSRLGRPVSCGVFFFVCCSRCVRRSCFPARGALGLGVLFAPPPPFFLCFFCCPPPCFFNFCSSIVLCSWRFSVFFFPPPGLLFFFFLLPCLLLFFFCGCCAVWGPFVCLWLWGVLVCGAVGAAVCGALCVSPAAVWRACAWLGSCALLSGAVLRLVLLGCFCCSLLSCAAVFSAGCFFCVLLCVSVVVCVVLVCVVLGRGAACCVAWACRVVLVLASVALCRLVLCRAVVRLLVLCCVVCFVAVLRSGLASSAAVACCCALSVLGRGAVSSCCAACGPCAVVPCAVFFGASIFVAPLVWCCVGVPVSLLFVRCSLAPLALAAVCVVACCVRVFAVGLGCPLLSPSGSRCRVSVVLSLSDRVAGRPVVWCGVSWRSAPLCCVLWCCAVGWWCAVVLCCLFASLPVLVVCFLPLRFLLCVSWCASLWLVGLLWRPAPLCCVL